MSTGLPGIAPAAVSVEVAARGKANGLAKESSWPMGSKIFLEVPLTPWCIRGRRLWVEPCADGVSIHRVDIADVKDRAAPTVPRSKGRPFVIQGREEVYVKPIVALSWPSWRSEGCEVSIGASEGAVQTECLVETKACDHVARHEGHRIDAQKDGSPSREATAKMMSSSH
eukprot:CAMPEP_0115172684 /NCGR_PEP_ID=MMETSP0270-20121206/2942_1 /TAXON_ID=71861 /ORGANISM="Scrippsiella trochoidea, Strain CCMP3099" /LENGTH=169 /DNA_ID=CAMNT_0002585483 /DNA_START=97 /DNA_END=604 /DNA_ORIENTATION=-